MCILVLVMSSVLYEIITRRTGTLSALTGFGRIIESVTEDDNQSGGRLVCGEYKAKTKPVLPNLQHI